MRHRQAKGIALGVGGLLVILLAGCQINSPKHSTSWMDKFRPFQGGNLSELVMLDVALVEQPAFDPYLCQELWNLADEQGVPLDRKAQMEDNGFRVGQVGVVTPPGLQALLTSERSCLNPRRISTKAGTAKELPLGPPAPTCRCQIHEDGQAEDLSLEQAEFSFVVKPTLTKDRQVTLRFTPKVRYGEPEQKARPTVDRSGLVLQAERPVRTFEGLSWEVTVPGNEYVIVGARSDKPDSLGFQCFVRNGEAKPVQRLLVIRTMRSEPGVAKEYGPKGGSNDPLIRSPSLASQAAMSSVRGKGP